MSYIHIAFIRQEKLLHAPQLSYECRRLYNEHAEFHYISQEKGEGVHYSSCSMLPNLSYECRSLYSEHD